MGAAAARISVADRSHKKPASAATPGGRRLARVIRLPGLRLQRQINRYKTQDQGGGEECSAGDRVPTVAMPGLEGPESSR